MRLALLTEKSSFFIVLYTFFVVGVVVDVILSFFFLFFVTHLEDLPAPAKLNEKSSSFETEEKKIVKTLPVFVGMIE